ncbi:MAG: pyridoxamine 5'-phosphate oxidase family protein [Erysipelotrichaceae bacterium]|nr:pyridoxamine 5'-phosphate oxidase family protein [Erysipelotrichaceae bacterium]
MFRDVTRYKQKLTTEECIDILIHTKRGVLSVNGDEGYPYCMPINHYYRAEDGNIYFHGGKHGHKIDALKNDDRVCFCVYSDPIEVEGEWYYDFKSVIVFGRARPVDDETMIKISRELCYKFTDDEAYIEREIENHAAGTLAFEIIPEHITGKIVHER